MKEKLFIIKIGGNVIDKEDDLKTFLEDFSKITDKKILVHGGGKIASQIGTRLGIEPNYHEGRRITDDETIDLVTMVYGGLINKKIVAQLNAFGSLAVGLTGSDANSIIAHKRPITDGVDFGWVGDIDQVNTRFFNSLLTNGITPVLAPLTGNIEGHILNTNADTIASEVAQALSDSFETHLIYCFEKPGVLKEIEDENSIVDRIDRTQYKQMCESGVINTGMIPKLTNSFKALRNGVSQVVIGHSRNVLSLTKNDFQQCTRINL
ncbi:MAG: acetylglutamate kinase [Bacteroidetes bacterium]|nr:acetylglutamate kinase [Bacteroidota bacterium]MDA1120040.1 acetylglutamate kinase [Bacteroidota bacterium]